MGHLTALKDLCHKGFVIFGGSGARAEAKAISTSPRHRRALNIPEPTRSAPKSGS